MSPPVQLQLGLRPPGERPAPHLGWEKQGRSSGDLFCSSFLISFLAWGQAPFP